MSRSYIPIALRRRVAQDARYRCGYCRTAEFIIGKPMEVDHIVPEARGGATVEANLWLACDLCNGYKGDRVQARDPATHALVRLFDPRHQVWSEHFAWSQDGTRIIGLTPTGRATVVALRLNHVYRVRSRAYWVEAGWHPPDG